jgi:hypothetical protein
VHEDKANLRKLIYSNSCGELVYLDTDNQRRWLYFWCFSMYRMPMYIVCIYSIEVIIVYLDYRVAIILALTVHSEVDSFYQHYCLCHDSMLGRCYKW